jgi:hypothetical protein
MQVRPKRVPTRADSLPFLQGRRGRHAAKAPRGRTSKHTLVDEEPSWPDRMPSLAGYEGSWPDRLPTQTDRMESCAAHMGS